MFLIIEEVKETILDFLQGTAKLLKTRSMNFVWFWYKMTEYHSVNLNLSDFQLSKLKSAAKNATGITLKLSSDMEGTDETVFCIIYYELIGKPLVFTILLKIIHRMI